MIKQMHGDPTEDVLTVPARLQTIRTLGQHMARLLKAKKAAEDAGIESPVPKKQFYEIYQMRRTTP